MKNTFRIKVKIAKPRNPVALAARQRNAGAHQPDDPARHERRVKKQQLRHFLLGRDTESEADN